MGVNLCRHVDALRDNPSTTQIKIHIVCILSMYIRISDNQSTAKCIQLVNLDHALRLGINTMHLITLNLPCVSHKMQRTILQGLSHSLPA